MNKKSGTSKDAADKLVKGIRRKTRTQYSAEEKIRIVLAGLRGEESIAALCRREGGPRENTGSGPAAAAEGAARWRRRLDAPKGGPGATPRTNAALERRRTAGAGVRGARALKEVLWSQQQQQQQQQQQRSSRTPLVSAAVFRVKKHR